MNSSSKTTNAATAHGLDGTMVVPDWPPLTLAEVRALLGQYPGCEEPLAIESVSPRPFSAASVVKTRTRRVFVKRHHHTVRNRQGLGEEHRFLEFLASRKAAVPRLLRSAAGETVTEAGEWTYEVHEEPEGMDLYGDALSWTPFRSSVHATEAGKALARLHLAARDFAAPARPPRPLVASFSIYAGDDPASALDSYLARRPRLATDATRDACSSALELLEPFHAELRPWLPRLTPLWTHNDLHPSNLFWSDETNTAHATAIIDFGLSDRTNAVHDLAHAIVSSIVEWLCLAHVPSRPEQVVVHFDHLEALLDGYEQIRPLSPGEAAALAPLTALCHVEFALTEADYFLGILGSPEKARVATEDYLVGHARWFHSGRGGALLDALRTRSRKKREEGAKP